MLRLSSKTHIIESPPMRQIDCSPFADWRILGQTHTDCHSDAHTEWKTELSQRIGYKPRRISQLAQMALLGVLQCLEKANQPALPHDCAIRIITSYGTAKTTQTALTDLKNQEPVLPFAFLQTQVSQILAAISQTLHWQGEGLVFTAANEPLLVQQLIATANSSLLLIGWLDENMDAEMGCNEWVLLGKNRSLRVENDTI